MNDEEWFAEHNAYLDSQEWAYKRDLVLERDGYRCQAVLSVCDGVATHVHHKTYRYWREEPLFDLVSLCRACHDELTDMDRAARPHKSRLERKPVPIPVWERKDAF